MMKNIELKKNLHKVMAINEIPCNNVNKSYFLI